MDDHNNSQNDHESGDSESISTENAVASGEYNPDEWTKPPKRDPITGRFIAGTGASKKGGRPVGAKDRVSRAMVDLATELVANRGAELFEAMADRDPAQALALVAKIVPPEEMRAIFQEERTGETRGQPVQINIGIVKWPERLSDVRSQAQITDQQRGLNSPVERLRPEPEADNRVVADQARAEADEQAAREKRELARRQNETIKAHGGLTGRPRRAEVAPDAIEYRDDGDWL